MVSCGTLTVEQPQASISLQNCNTSPSGGEVGQNDTVEVSATAVNTGDASGGVTVTFYANGQTVESRSRTVSPGGTSTVSATFTPAQLGLSGSVQTEVQLSGPNVSAAAEGQSQSLLADGGCQSCGH
jgi:hypothetical protein